MPRRILAVCLDFGDTLADQATEVRDDAGTLLEIDLIEGALELVRELRARGYRLALVADGEVRDARNVLAQHGLDELFDAVVISEEVGAQKPDPSMFCRALGELGLSPPDHGRAVMVGNRLERDVKGLVSSAWSGCGSTGRRATQSARPSPPPSPTTSSGTRSSCSSASSERTASEGPPGHSAKPCRP